MDLRQSKEYGHYMESNGWVVERISNNGVLVFLKKIPMLSLWVMKIQRFEEVIDWEEIRDLRKKYWVIYTIIEPVLMTPLPGFKLSGSAYLPTKTLVVNLDKKEETLWSDLSKDAKQRIKKAKSLSVFEFKLWPARKEFWGEWKKYGKGFVPSLNSFKNLSRCFKDNCLVIAATKKDRMIAGCIVLISNRKAYYYYAWTNEMGRSLNAQFLLVWNAMKIAKNKGCKSWDFEGIEDVRWPRESWKGFSLFKRKFGGKEIEYPGCFEKWF